MTTPKKTKSGKKLTELITKEYINLHQGAHEGKFVVWVAIVVPVEIFQGFNNIVYAVPESHAAMCAAKGASSVLSEKAEEAGYSTDLCSYARIDYGSYLDKGKKSPTMGLPKPDLLISNNNNCSLIAKWFDIYHHELDIPHIVLDIPFCYESQKKDDYHYIINQFKGLIKILEDMTNQKCNMDKIREAVNYTSLASKHWKRYLDFAALHPSGITAFDTFVHMTPFLISRGTPDLLEHCKFIADEVEERIKNKIYPVPNEKYRLLWDNIAPWHQLRKMSKRLAKLEANIVAATYTSCIGAIEGSFDFYEFDNIDPIKYLARIQNFSICPYGLNLRYKAMEKEIKRLDINGVVFASNRSCKVYSIMQFDLKRKISENCGIPTVMIDVDHADIRKYDEEQTFVRLEALIERINEKNNK